MPGAVEAAIQWIGIQLMFGSAPVFGASLYASAGLLASAVVIAGSNELPVQQKQRSSS